MILRLWALVRARIESARQNRSAVVTAETLIWHHGYKGLDAALKAADTRTGNFQHDVRAELVARIAADRYVQFNQADVFQRAMLLDRWSRRRGQMIHPTTAPFARAASAG